MPQQLSAIDNAGSNFAYIQQKPVMGICFVQWTLPVTEEHSPDRN